MQEVLHFPALDTMRPRTVALGGSIQEQEYGDGEMERWKGENVLKREKRSPYIEFRNHQTRLIWVDESELPAPSLDFCRKKMKLLS